MLASKNQVTEQRRIYSRIQEQLTTVDRAIEAVDKAKLMSDAQVVMHAAEQVNVVSGHDFTCSVFGRLTSNNSCPQIEATVGMG